MRKLILLSLCLAGQSWSQQWSPGLNVTYFDPGSSWTAPNQGHSLAVNGDTVYLVWYNSTVGLVNMGHQVYFKKYDGTSWDTINTLIGFTGNYRRHSWYPSCAMGINNELHVVWESNDFIQTSEGASIYDIAYRKLSQGVWSGVTRVTSNLSQGYSWRPVVACGPDGVVRMVWQDNRQGTFKIFYKTLTGGTWSSDLCLSPQGIYAGFPSIALSGSQPAVAWQDFREGVNQVYFIKYSASGWGQDSAISQSVYGAFAPCLAGDQAGNLHVAWEDIRDGNFEIYYRRFNAQTQTWENVIRLTDDPYYSRQPFLQCQSDGSVNLFWTDDREGSYEIYRRRAVNNVWELETTLTQFDGMASLSPSAAENRSGNLHLAWSDFSSYYQGSDGIYYQVPDIFYMSGSYSKKEAVENQTALAGPAGLALLPARPNPTSGKTMIALLAGQGGWARVRVYNIAGQMVRELYQGQLAEGRHDFEWDTRDGDGKRVSNGLYLARAECSGSSVTGKIMVVR